MKPILMSVLTACLLTSTAGMSGCMRAYSVHMGEQTPEDAHYVVVQTRKNGRMLVYDCLSYPDEEWKPTCVRAKMRKWAGGRGDGPEELVDE